MPSATSGTGPRLGSGFAQVAAGHYRTAAVKADGTLWTWGANEFGALGNGTTGDRRSPDRIGMGFAKVAVGEFHMTAVKTSRTLWAWGDNGHGQLGDGTLVGQLSPVQIP
jgi:alpha-tubulin suppressor-like RCC1 family protein